MDGTVETRTSGGWLGHVRANVTLEILSTSAAAGSRFGEVGGVTVNVEDHVTGGILDRDGTRVNSAKYRPESSVRIPSARGWNTTTL